MKNSTSNKTKLTATIAIVLLMISAFTLMINAPVQAQDEYENMQEGGSIPLPPGVTPDLTLDTNAYLSFRPNPVGVGQTILVNMWMVPSLHVSRYFSDYKVTITDPDGNEDVITMDSFRADTTAWFEYVVDQVGTWKLKFDFAGGYFPPGNYTAHVGAVFYPEGAVFSFPNSVYYLPSSSPESELVVQEEQVLSWPPSGLPTDYWTRPVSPVNREWAQILGWYPWNGLGGGPNWPADTNIYANTDYDFTPYVQGPESAHVVWRRRLVQSGLVGGDLGTFSFYGPSFGGGPNIIYEGRCYQTITKAVDGETTNVWQCYDLRTGEVYWERTGVSAPNRVHFESGHGEVPGAIPVFGLTDYLVGISGGYLRKYDPWDGSLDLERELPSLGSTTIYSDPYVLSVQNLGGGNHRLINWTLDGSTSNFPERVMSNITWPWSNLGSSQDFEAGIAASVSSINDNLAAGGRIATRIRATSLKTGAELWDITVDQWHYSGSCVVADHGKVAVLMQGGYFNAYDLQTGNLAWKSEAMDYPWGECCFGTYGIHSAYGMIYRAAYDGVYAFDWDNGDIAWRYKPPSVAYETPYAGYNAFMGHATIADGKLYIGNSEHTPTQPVTRGWKLHCIDAFTGEGIWNMSGSAGYSAPGAIADGYLTAINAYDGYMYVYGKGQSATTVTAPDVAVPKGTAITIKGTVLDMSPAQEGTPCVSAESMTLQMEYLHLQRPIGGIWGNETITGVPVTLTAIGSDGSYIDIGTTTTNGYYGTFGVAWTPPEEGTYEIIASFESDESYGSSAASTAVTAGPAEVDLSPVEDSVSNVEGSVSDLEATISSQTTYIIATLALVIIAIVIAVYSALKPRK